uniref:Uncharacterized protein n=1 Tax=Anopheles coluzzii TaxID=1518534 RepID=A0A8W7P0G0_ANOCL
MSRSAIASSVYVQGRWPVPFSAPPPASADPLPPSCPTRCRTSPRLVDHRDGLLPGFVCLRALHFQVGHFHGQGKRFVDAPYAVLVRLQGQIGTFVLLELDRTLDRGVRFIVACFDCFQQYCPVEGKQAMAIMWLAAVALAEYAIGRSSLASDQPAGHNLYMILFRSLTRPIVDVSMVGEEAPEEVVAVVTTIDVVPIPGLLPPAIVPMDEFARMFPLWCAALLLWLLLIWSWSASVPVSASIDRADVSDDSEAERLPAPPVPGSATEANPPPFDRRSPRCG